MSINHPLKNFKTEEETSNLNVESEIQSEFSKIELRVSKRRSI